MKNRSFIFILVIGLLIAPFQPHALVITEDEVYNDIFCANNGIVPYTGYCVVFYQDSQHPKIKISYKEGKIHGLIRFYYPNGMLKQRGYYHEGLLSGKWEAWYQDGGEKYTAYYENDILCGDYISYYKNGSVKEKWTVNRSRLTGEKTL